MPPNTAEPIARYRDVLKTAHEPERGLLGIRVRLIQKPNQDNRWTAICRATLRARVGDDLIRYTDYGDANPDNAGPKAANALIRLSATRAKARVVKDFIGEGAVTDVEMSEEEPYSRPARAQQRRPKPTADPTQPISDDQRHAIERLSQTKHVNADNLAQDRFDCAVDNLTQAQAAQLIAQLNALKPALTTA